MDWKVNWTTDDVCQFISKEGFDDEVVELFRDNKIRGKTLPLLDDNDLRELGIKALGDRKHLFQLFKIGKLNSEELEHQQPNTDDAPIGGEEGSGLLELDGLSTDDEQERDDFTVAEIQVDSSTQIAPEKSNNTDHLPVQVGSSTQQASKKSNKTDCTLSAAAQCVIVLDQEEKPIPDPFPFPVTYGTAIDVGLHTGQMSKTVTAKFYTRIANVMAIYKYHPDHAEYDRVSREIVKKYPFLKNPINGHLSSITTLQKRFREIRRKNDKNGKPIIRKLSEKAIASGSGKKRKFEVPEEEDEDSFLQQNKTLKSEGKKAAKYINRTLVGELMTQTFPMRRKKIEEKAVPLSALFVEYPLLKDPHEVIAELARLQENTQLRSTYNDTWHQWLPKLIKAIKINMTMATTKRMKEIDVNKDLEDEDAGRLTLKVLYALAFVLKDHKCTPEIDKLMTITPVTVDLTAISAGIVEPAPSLIVTGHLCAEIKQVTVAAEKQELFTTTALEAPLSLLSAYYTYNISYPKGLQTFYTFLEYIILEKKPPKKMPSTLEQFITYLHSI